MTTSLPFSALQEAVERLAADPRVEPSTAIRLEYPDHHFPSMGTDTSSLVTIALHNSAGSRYVVLSALARHDALVR